MKIGCDRVLKIDTGNIDLAQVKALVDVTEKFIMLADELLGKGDISQEEYESMTLFKKDFIDDVKTKYL